MGFRLFHDLPNEVNGGSLPSLSKILGDDHYAPCSAGLLVKSIPSLPETAGNFQITLRKIFQMPSLMTEQEDA